MAQVNDAFQVFKCVLGNLTKLILLHNLNVWFNR